MMDIPKYEPVSYLLAVESLEDESEEASESGARDEAEMCEVVAVGQGSRFQEGQVVFVEPMAFHMATRLDGAAFVSESAVLAIAVDE